MIICTNHETEIPMIQTFAFMGAELWCPCCGNSTGFPFGDFNNIDSSEELELKQERMRAACSEYLHAMGIRYCSKTEYKGNIISPRDLPDEEKQRLAEIRINFKHLPEGF